MTRRHAAIALMIAGILSLFDGVLVTFGAGPAFITLGVSLAFLALLIGWNA